MAGNSVLTASIIAKEAIRILNNNLQMAKCVYRGYEEEFSGEINGYKKGQTITIRRPDQATIRVGAVAQVQNIDEGSVSLTVNNQIGTDFKFTSSDLSLNIGALSERVIKPRLVRLANKIDQDLMSLYAQVYNTVGTFGASPTTLTSFADYFKSAQRLNEESVPGDERYAMLSPADHAGMLGSQTALFIQEPAKDAYRKANLGMIGDIDTYMSQNVPTYSPGSAQGTGTPVLSTTGSVGTATGVYDNVKTTWTQTIGIRGFSASKTMNAGDVFTIAGVFAVNNVTKVARSYLQQFVVTAAVTTNSNTASDTAVVVSPPLIASGAYQTVSAIPADGATITYLGTTGQNYPTNLVFHKNAFALVVVPLEIPPGAPAGVARESFEGVSVRVAPFWDGTNDVSNWRLDILYGYTCVDARLAVRLGGH